jgi:hypothetical protein
VAGASGADRTVEWSKEQIKRAREVLEVVVGLLEHDQRALDRANFKERYMSVVFWVVMLDVLEADRELSAAWSGFDENVAHISKKTVQTVRRFRALGPSRLKSTLFWKRSSEEAKPVELT